MVMSFSDAQLMLNQAHNYKEDGATFIQTFIQLIQDTVTTRKI